MVTLLLLEYAQLVFGFIPELSELYFAQLEKQRDCCFSLLQCRGSLQCLDEVCCKRNELFWLKYFLWDISELTKFRHHMKILSLRCSAKRLYLVFEGFDEVFHGQMVVGLDPVFSSAGGFWFSAQLFGLFRVILRLGNNTCKAFKTSEFVFLKLLQLLYFLLQCFVLSYRVLE